MHSREKLTTSQDGPVEAALAEYFLRLDRGQSVDLSELIAAHPGCETELREFVAQERRVNRAVTAVVPAAEVQSDLAGRTLGDFRLKRIIGRGGMGIVFQAEQLSLRRKVAVKLLPGVLCSDPRHRTRFQNEARILAQLEHANIVNVLSVGEDADTYYFAMQYVEGITADDLIRKWSDEGTHNAETACALADDTETEVIDEPINGNASGQVLPWVIDGADRRNRYRLCARIAAEVADGLAHAHACGVLHRDVKPSNILLDRNGTARLTDFGLARMCGDATLTATGAILGTLRYASPEQLGGAQAGVDERSDVYSLGITLWELVTGKRPFAGEDRNSVITKVLKAEPQRPSTLAPGLPGDLDTIIVRAIAKEPADRYSSAHALADDLRRFLDGLPIRATPISFGERTFRWVSRNRALATAAVGTLFVLTLVSLLASVLVLRANSRTATALAVNRESDAKARKHAVAAEASEQKTRELHYAADMAMAGAAWKKHDFAHVREFLERYATPKIGANGLSEEDLRGFEWYFLDRQTRNSSELLYENKEAPYVIHFMPGSDEFLTAGKDSVVRWHDSKTGKVLRSQDTKQGEINCVSYSPSGSLFATGGDDGTVKIWRAADLSLAHAVKAHEGKCEWAKFLNNEKLLTGGWSKAIQLVDVTAGRILRAYETPEAKSAKSPRSFQGYICYAGKEFWTTANSTDGIYRGIYKWNLETGESHKYSTDAALSNILMDRSERFLFANTERGSVRIFDAQSGAELWSYLSDTKLEAMALSPDERQLIVGDNKGQIYVWDIDRSDPAKIIRVARPRAYSVHRGDFIDSAAFAPDGNSLVTVGRDKCARRTNLSSQQVFRDVSSQCKYSFPVITTSPTPLVFFENEPISFRDMQVGERISPNAFLHLAPTSAVSDSTLAVVTKSNQLGIIKAATGELVVKIPFAQTAVCFDFSTDGSLLAIVSESNKKVQTTLLDLRKGTLRPFPAASETSPLWVLFCVDNGLIAWLPATSQLVCWNIRDGAVRWLTKPSEIRDARVSISPNRDVLVTADGQDISLIDCMTGSVRSRARSEHLGSAVAILPDGRSFVLGGEQGQVSIWRISPLQPLFETGNIGIGSSIWSIRPLPNGFLAGSGKLVNGRKRPVWFEF